MNSTQVGIVWNPAKTTQAELETALQVATGEGKTATVRWFETSIDDPGRAATQQALDAGSEVICAAGGDGTIRVVAEHLADTGASADLGIIPLGTGNLLARNLSIPLNDLPAAFTIALSTQAHHIDIGWAEITTPNRAERHAFTVMAGFGIDAHMITETDDDLKDRAGWLAYVESLGRALAASEVIDLSISVDESELGREQAHTIIVGNCGILQGGIPLLPDADPSDGELDLLILHAAGVPGWAGTLRNMVWDNGVKRFLAGGDESGPAESNETTTHRRVTSVSVELAEPRVFEVDGDELDETRHFSVSIQPAAIRVRSSQASAAEA